VRPALVSLLALGVAALLPLGGPAVADTSDEQALADKYAPVLMLVEQTKSCGPGEPYRPSDVSVMFDNPTIALRGPWTPRDLVDVGPSQDDVSVGLPGFELDLPGDPLDPGCAYEKWARSQWAGTDDTIYANVATQRGVTDRIALQFYFFYAFNDYNNKHETDWERIQIEFDAPDAASALTQEPVQVVYSQHYGSERADWDDDKLERVLGTHPVVYVSAGSHANQFSPGVFMGNSAVTGFGCDTTVGRHDQVVPIVRTIPSDPEEGLAAYPWTGYEGHWGEVGPRRFYAGPTGPNMKAGWTKPFAWSDNARETSISVPGVTGSGGKVEQFYCDAVGKGSDLFRRYVANPAGGLAALAVALLLLGWVLRRTSWESTASPLMARRSAGEVVHAAFLAVRRDPSAYVAVAAPAALLEAVAAMAQTLALAGRLPGWVAAALVVLGGVGLAVAAAALTQVVSELDAGRRPTVAAAYAEGARRCFSGLPSLLVGALVLLVTAGSLVLAPVSLALLSAWLLLFPVLVVERRGGLTGLVRAVRLLRGSLRVVVPVVALVVLLLTTMGALLAAALFVVVPLPFVLLNAVPAMVLAGLLPFVSVLSAYTYASTVNRAGTQPAPEPTNSL
jgi:hypothetical protein